MAGYQLVHGFSQDNKGSRKQGGKPCLCPVPGGVGHVEDGLDEGGFVLRLVAAAGVALSKLRLSLRRGSRRGSQFAKVPSCPPDMRRAPATKPLAAAMQYRACMRLAPATGDT